MSEQYDRLNSFFSQPVCQRATKPLRDGVTLAVFVGEEAMSLQKMGGRLEVSPGKAQNPDMTFHLPPKGLEQLGAVKTEEIGEIGVAILKVMAHSDPQYRMNAKVHIGVFNLLRNGYLGILPLGGAPVMKFLGSKGLTSIGKIKDALARLRSQE